MMVSFNFALYPRVEMRRLHTHIVPLLDGLAEGGHRVERFAVGLRPPPVINVLPYHRAEGAAANDLIGLLQAGGAGFCAGLLCLDPVVDDMDDERAEDPVLARLAPVVDFVWSVLPPETVPGLGGAAGKTARIRYGYCARSLGPKADGHAVPPDIDVTLRGATTPRRKAVFDALSQRGFSCFWIDVLALPHYITDDILSRSKIVVDFRPEDGRRGGSPALTAQALHNAAVVVSEIGAPGWHEEFQPYSIPTPADQIVERCEQVLRSGLHAGLGGAALQKYRAETSMRETMEAALRLPAIARQATVHGAV